MENRGMNDVKKNYYIKQIDSMFAVTDHRWRQNVVRPSGTDSSIALCRFVAFTIFWHHLWSITEQTRGNMKIDRGTITTLTAFHCLASQSNRRCSFVQRTYLVWECSPQPVSIDNITSMIVGLDSKIQRPSQEFSHVKLHSLCALFHLKGDSRTHWSHIFLKTVTIHHLQIWY